LLTDETFVVAMTAISKKASVHSKWMHGLNLTAYIAWILACLIGAMIGNWLPDPRMLGLDYALVAMFVGLLYLQLISDSRKSKKNMLLVMLTVSVLLVFSMKFMSAELALLSATLLGYCGSFLLY